MSADAANVFLSYSRADTPAVRQIQAYLKQAGLAAFLDRDQLPAGQPCLSALEQAIARCAAIAVLVGPAGLGTWQQREVQLALDRQAERQIDAAESCGIVWKVQIIWALRTYCFAVNSAFPYACYFYPLRADLARLPPLSATKKNRGKNQGRCVSGWFSPHSCSPSWRC